MSAPASSILNHVDGVLHMEDVPLPVVAEAVGTPAYIYSSAYIRTAIADIRSAFTGMPLTIQYAVKANSNLSILALCHAEGCSFDIVSGGELARLLAAGIPTDGVIFSGVGKSVAEIDFALKAEIACFNIESEPELERVAARAEVLNIRAPISIRVNPNVDAQTHPYISTGLKQNKFGVAPELALELYRRADAHDWLDVAGIDCHIGSQIGIVEPLLESLSCLLELVDQLAAEGIALHHIDLGGGMGVTYQNETPLDMDAYGAGVRQILGARKLALMLEPGRSIVANAGVLLSRVEYLKPAAEAGAPSFAVIDAAMNDLIRPALYQAWHDVLPVNRHEAQSHVWNIVGPVCETGDFLAHERELALEPDSLVAIASAGAYGMVQASNYNARNRACEVLVDGGEFRVIRRRETMADQLRLEQELPG